MFDNTTALSIAVKLPTPFMAMAIMSDQAFNGDTVNLVLSDPQFPTLLMAVLNHAEPEWDQVFYNVLNLVSLENVLVCFTFSY